MISRIIYQVPYVCCFVLRLNYSMSLICRGILPFSCNNHATMKAASNGIPPSSPASDLQWSLLSSPPLRPCRLQAIEQAVLARLVLFLAVKLGHLRLSQEENRGATILTLEELIFAIIELSVYSFCLRWSRNIFKTLCPNYMKNFPHIRSILMRKSCDGTFVIKTLRQHIESGRIDLSNLDWNQRIMLAGMDGFT